MKKYGLTLLAIGGLAASTLAVAAEASAQSQQVAERALEAAVDLYRDVGVLCADFDQTVEVTLLSRTVESAGRLCQQRPNLFSMRFSEPDGDMVISDGSYVWAFYPSDDPEQVVRYGAARAPGGYDLFREFLDRPREKYEISSGGRESVRGSPCDVVVLVPRAGQDVYRQARLWLDQESSLIHQLEVLYENGSIRTLTFAETDLAPRIPESTFVFELPDGVRVFDAPVGGR